MEILPKPNDDPEFVELVNSVISGCISGDFPAKIFVVKVENWFDHKWLDFSGIGRVEFFEDFRLEIDTALDEFRQDKTTLPPFSPKRVIEEHYFVRDEKGFYSRSSRIPRVHPKKLGPSSLNLHQRIADHVESALLLWFSSNTNVNRRGSIMVYEVNGSVVNTWYAGLDKGTEWRVLKTKGITRQQITSLIRNAVTQTHA